VVSKSKDGTEKRCIETVQKGDDISSEIDWDILESDLGIPQEILAIR
jgi:hypothetical protein